MTTPDGHPSVNIVSNLLKYIEANREQMRLETSASIEKFTLVGSSCIDETSSFVDIANVDKISSFVASSEKEEDQKSATSSTISVQSTGARSPDSFQALPEDQTDGLDGGFCSEPLRHCTSDRREDRKEAAEKKGDDIEFDDAIIAESTAQVGENELPVKEETPPEQGGQVGRRLSVCCEDTAVGVDEESFFLAKRQKVDELEPPWTNYLISLLLSPLESEDNSSYSIVPDPPPPASLRDFPTEDDASDDFLLSTVTASQIEELNEDGSISRLDELARLFVASPKRRKAMRRILCEHPATSTLVTLPSSTLSGVTWQPRSGNWLVTWMLNRKQQFQRFYPENRLCEECVETAKVKAESFRLSKEKGSSVKQVIASKCRHPIPSTPSDSEVMESLIKGVSWNRRLLFWQVSWMTPGKQQFARFTPGNKNCTRCIEEMRQEAERFRETKQREQGKSALKKGCSPENATCHHPIEMQEGAVPSPPVRGVTWNARHLFWLASWMNQGKQQFVRFYPLNRHCSLCVEQKKAEAIALRRSKEESGEATLRRKKNKTKPNTIL